MRTFGVVFNLFVCVILSRYNAVTAVIYVENGKNVTLNPNIQGKPEEILWTFNGNKLAEHDLTEFHEYGQFKGRSGIETTTGQLTVRHMTSQDSGFYRSVIQIDGRQQNSENQVQVIDAVQEPNVTCKLNNITNSKTLFCSVSSQIQASYEWTGSNLVQYYGQELPISKEEKPDSVFTCTVKNEVSQKKASFPLKDCPTDIPQPENIRESENIILRVILPSIIGAIVVVLIMVVAIYFIRQRRKKDPRRSGDRPEDGTQEKLIMSELPGTEVQSVNQALRKNHVSEDSGKQNVNEDGDVSEKNEEAEMKVDSEFNEDVNQSLKNSHNAENNEEPNISEDADKSDKNEEAERMVDNESGEDLHNYEDDEQEIYEVQDLTGPAQE